MKALEQTLFNIAMVEPEIPQNTGNIGRTCVGLNASLHLVEPMMFEINDKNLKRAGLDYWPHLTWKVHKDWHSVEKQFKNPKRVFYFSAKADRLYYDVEYQPDDWFVFGKETKGLPDDLLQRNAEQCLLIPILGPVRGYNVATAVAMVLSEAYRQVRSKGLGY